MGRFKHFAWVTTFLACSSWAICSGQIALDASVSLGMYKATHNARGCDYEYDAIEGQLLQFVATARAERKLDFTLLVSWSNDFFPLSNCPVEHCLHAENCTITCNVTTSATSSDAGIYRLTASPYDLRIGDVVQTVCVRVQGETDLRFMVTPAAMVTVRQSDNLTLSYAASGYPRPYAYSLSCDGGFNLTSVDGAFSLSGLAVGKTVCLASASNGVRRVASAPTEITVLGMNAVLQGRRRRTTVTSRDGRRREPSRRPAVKSNGPSRRSDGAARRL